MNYLPKKTHPEIYVKNGKEKLRKKQEKERLEQLAREAEAIANAPPPQHEVTQEEVTKALEDLLDEGKVHEWDETHPKVIPVPLSSGSGSAGLPYGRCPGPSCPGPRPDRFPPSESWPTVHKNLPLPWRITFALSYVPFLSPSPVSTGT